MAVRVNTDVTLKLKDFSKIGSITEQLTDRKISESLSVNYTLDNLDDAKSKAVEDAYRRPRTDRRIHSPERHGNRPRQCPIQFEVNHGR